MSAKTGVLAHYEGRGSRPSTHVSDVIARLLVHRMVAERISSKLIRMLPPDSVFPVKQFTRTTQFVPTKLPPVEIGGCHFRLPNGVRPTTVPRALRLPRFREYFAEERLFPRVSQ